MFQRITLSRANIHLAAINGNFYLFISNQNGYHVVIMALEQNQSLIINLRFFLKIIPRRPPISPWSRFGRYLNSVQIKNRSVGITRNDVVRTEIERSSKYKQFQYRNVFIFTFERERGFGVYKLNQIIFARRRIISKNY